MDVKLGRPHAGGLADGEQSRGGRGWPLELVLAIVLVSVLVDLWWLNRFREGFPLDIDESRYLEFGLALKDNLAGHDLAGFWHTWKAQHDFAPLLPLSSVPVYAALGASVLNGLATQLFFFAVLILATYGIATRLSSPAGGALAALVVAATPAVIDFTRTYQFGVTAAAMLAACTYALLASEALSRRGWSLAWGVLLGLTALSRTMMVAFMPAQVVAALWLSVVRHEDRGERARNLALGLVAAIATAAIWFASSWHAVVHYLTNLGYGGQSAEFGTSRSRLSVGYWTRELVDTVRADLYLPSAILLVLAFASGLAVWLRRLGRQRAEGTASAWVRSWAFGDTVVVLFVVAEAYLALTSSRNEGVGFRLPVYAGLVALAVAAIWQLPWRTVRTGLVAGLIVVSVANVAMKADVVSGISRVRTVDVPGLGRTPVTSGQGYIQGYVFGAFEATPGPVTEPLPTSQKGWLPAYTRLVERLRALRPEPALVGLATIEPLLNPNDLTLAAQLHFGEEVPVTPLGAPAGPPTAPAYRQVLAALRRPSALITVSRVGLSYPALTGGQSLDQELLRRQAASLGFAPVSTVELPNRRHAVVSWRR